MRLCAFDMIKQPGSLEERLALASVGKAGMAINEDKANPLGIKESLAILVNRI